MSNSIKERIKKIENSFDAQVKNKGASITTTGINIKCLRVDGRNLTMSVFRQIPEKWMMDENYNFKGKGIWGWVNYFWKGNDYADIHTIWQKENKLYRFPMFGPVTLDGYKSIYNGSRHVNRYIPNLPNEAGSDVIAYCANRYNQLYGQIKEDTPQLYIAT